MKIREIKKDKRKYMKLLLIADEQESMIEKYISRGRMYVLEDGDLKTVCIVTDEKDRTLEIKNIVTVPEYQKMGYAKIMISFLEDIHKKSHDKIQVGTGESPLTLPFYKKCGFEESFRIKDFFTKNYDHEIMEDGVILKDMVYLSKSLK